MGRALRRQREPCDLEGRHLGPGTHQLLARGEPRLLPSRADKIVFSSPYSASGGEEILVVPPTGGTPTAAHQQFVFRPRAGLVTGRYEDRLCKQPRRQLRDLHDERRRHEPDAHHQRRRAAERNPSWQPLPYPGYARPKGATPVRVSLVPAHASALRRTARTARRSHTGRVQPERARVGATHHGHPRQQRAGDRHERLRALRAVLGDPSTPGDEADIALRVQITDVREQGTLADYAGEVEARAQPRGSPTARERRRPGDRRQHPVPADHAVHARRPTPTSARPAPSRPRSTRSSPARSWKDSARCCSSPRCRWSTAAPTATPATEPNTCSCVRAFSSLNHLSAD